MLTQIVAILIIATFPQSSAQQIKKHGNTATISNIKPSNMDSICEYNETQSECDPLHRLLCISCLRTSADVKAVQNIFKKAAIDYDTILALTEDDLQETFKDIGVKVWHRRLIINKLKTVQGSAVNKFEAHPVLILPTEQNDFLVNQHKHASAAKQNRLKMEELEAEIRENAKKTKNEIQAHYAKLMEILSKQKDEAMQKVDAIVDRKLQMVEKQHVSVNEAIQLLKESDSKIKNIIGDKTLDIIKKQIAITEHIGASLQQLMKYKPYLNANMSFVTQPTLKYKIKNVTLFEKFTTKMDQVLDADIIFSKIKFIPSSAGIVIEWKSDLNNVSNDTQIELEFKTLDKGQKDKEKQWNKLQTIKSNQTKIYLLGGNHDDLKYDEVDIEDENEDQHEIQIYDDIDGLEDIERFDELKEEYKGKAGLLSGSTYYQFRITINMTSNAIPSNVLTAKTPRFNLIGSTIITVSEQAQLIRWLKASDKTQSRLLFRATRDGFGSTAFHTKCDDQGATLVIVQSTNNHVFGGYTVESWKDTVDWVKDEKAWIYLLRSSKGDQPERWTPTKHPQKAIYAHDNYGPTFGGGHDCYISNDCNKNTNSYSNLGYSYSADNDKTKLAGTFKFKVTEYEVWNVF